jgi:predicted PhzF superfamily epimerase YddE/YHI9
VRAFVPPGVEDPVTGSLNASLAQWLIGAGLAPAAYVAAQGAALGRAGRVHSSAATATRCGSAATSPAASKAW